MAINATSNYYFSDIERFIEENHEYKIASRSEQNRRGPRHGPPLEVMQFWGPYISLVMLATF